MSVEDGGPAFPVVIGTQADQHLSSPGMSVRAWLTGQALIGLLKCPVTPEEAGLVAVRAADSALAALQKPARLVES